MAAAAEPVRQAPPPAATPGQLRAAALLLALALVSSLAVIQATHQCRQRYARLQQLEETRWALDEEYSRLLLEQSTWASHYRVARVAARDMAMAPAPPARRRVLAR